MLPSLIYLFLVVAGIIATIITSKSALYTISHSIGTIVILFILYWGGFFDKLLMAL